MEVVISMCKKRATESMEHFLLLLRFVPADKLNWSPTPTAKSAMQIAAHCAGYGGAFASILRTGKFPSVEEFLGPIEAARAAAIYGSDRFNYSSFVVAALLFILLTIPLARFTDRLIARDQRRRRAGSMA